tara:strand:+ start:270 stop:995 length:726 start_codon:yes stop_codon:yes gene_type:complete
MNNELVYGQGVISINPRIGYTAFDITFTGKINGRIVLNSDWVVVSNAKRVIGFLPSGLTVNNELTIMEYKGNLKIESCFIADTIEKYECIILHPDSENFFNDSLEVFSSSNEKLNELTAIKPNKNRRKTSISHLNLLTKQNEYYYKDGSPVPEGTGYSIKLNPRQAFLGENKPIYQKLADNKLLNFATVKKPKLLKIKKTELKKYVKILKSKAQGTQPGRHGSDKNVSDGESDTYSGGGSD